MREHNESEEPEDLLRRIELYGKSEGLGLKLRDPESITLDEGLELAAEEIITTSIEMLARLAPHLPASLGEFQRQIEEALSRYPEVAFQLLWERAVEDVVPEA